MRADIQSELGNNEAALYDYSRAISFPNDSVTSRVNRVVIFYENNDFTSALIDMDRAIELEPEDISHYENRAEIYRALGKNHLAKQDLERFNLEASL